MPRWGNRQLEEFDLFGPFEDYSANRHVRNAQSVAGILEDIGVKYFDPNSSEYKRWARGCRELWAFVNKLQPAKAINDGSDQTTELLKVFDTLIATFDHTEHRFKRLVYSQSATECRSSMIAETWKWLNIYYRYASYAIVAMNLGNRTDETIIHMRVNLVTGESSETRKYTPMRISKRQRRKDKRSE